MSRIQLRVHGDVDALGSEIAGAVLRGLPPSMKAGAEGKRLAVAFRKDFGEKLRALLLSRELCGTLSWCSEELSPLGGEYERLKAAGMSVFTLSEPGVLQEVILSLSVLAYRAIARLRDEDGPVVSYTKIAQAVEAEIMRHAFDSERCGEHEFCREALAQ